MTLLLVGCRTGARIYLTSPQHIFDYEEDDFFRMAEALKVTSFTIWGAFAVGKHPMQHMVDHYGRLCERARQHGLRVDIEFTPICGIPDIHTAHAVISAAGAPNSGIIFDFWHFMRGNPDFEFLESLDGSRITMVQVCDAPAEIEPGLSLVEDSLFRRCQPGLGGFPVQRLLSILKRIGALKLAGPEIFSKELDLKSPEEISEISSDVNDLILGVAGN